MAPTKRSASTAAECWSVPLKSNLVVEALKHAELDATVKDMLCSSIKWSLGAMKESRHTSCQRVGDMIGEVLAASEAALVKDAADKETFLEALKPAKATREATFQSATEKVQEVEQTLTAANAAVVEADKAWKEASVALTATQKAQKVGDKDVDALAAKRAQLEAGHKDIFLPLSEGTSTEAEAKKMVRSLLSLAKTFNFDASLMTAVSTVLTKSKSNRTEFDETCTQQVAESFQNCLASLDAQIAEGAPAKAERAVAVDAALAQKTGAEETVAARQAERDAVKDQLSESKEATKAAKKSLTDFFPDLQKASDALDEATAALSEFRAGALAAYQALNERNEEWQPPAKVPRKSYYETVDGFKCDRGVIDACRTAVAGRGDGRVSVEDAMQVFEKIADGNKETQVERWTLRYCMQAFNWTEAAHDWIVEELKKVPQEDEAPSPSKKTGTEVFSGYYQTVDGMKLDRAIIDVCRESIVGQGDGRISVADAEKVWAKAADGNKVTDTEKWTVRYCLCAFNWTEAAHDWVLEEMKKVA